MIHSLYAIFIDFEQKQNIAADLPGAIHLPSKYQTGLYQLAEWSLDDRGLRIKNTRHANTSGRTSEKELNDQKSISPSGDDEQDVQQ